MHAFDTWGYGTLVWSAACGALVFLVVRRTTGLPWFLNAPGAAGVMAGGFMLGGWMLTASGLTAILVPDFPGVPWTSGAALLVLAGCWYRAAWVGTKWLQQVRTKRLNSS